MMDCPPLRAFAHVLSGGHVHTGGLSENCRFARHADPGADLHQGELAIPLASTKSDSVPCAACRHVKKSRLRASRLDRSEEHTSELQSPCNLVCRLLLEKKKNG